MRKKILEKKLARLSAKKDALKARALASTDANEVRSINEQIEDINAELEETRAELDVIAEEERSAVPSRMTPPADAQTVNAGVVGAFGMAQKEERSEDPTNSMEYRNAFMRFVQTGVISAELRAGSAINTEDTNPAIPLTIMNEVINTVRKRYGNLYNKVRKLSVQGGVEFPIGALQAQARWIGEKTVSPRQRLGALGKVSFKYFTLEIRVSQTFLSSILTLNAFEQEIAKAIAIAYLQAMDEAIVKGTGNGMPLGILNDARIVNTVTMTAAQFANWKDWRSKFFAKLPLGYRAGEFIFPLSTVETYLETMSDANNNPIFRQATGLEVNDGDALNPNGRFFGREVSLVEPEILPDFDTASSSDVVGIYWQPEEYGINENFGWSMRRYFDEEENEWVDKALAVTDGKVLNPTGYWLILKG